MEKFTNALRKFLGALIMGAGVCVLMLGAGIMYVGAWFANVPFSIGSSDDLSTDDLKKMYRDAVEREQGKK